MSMPAAENLDQYLYSGFLIAPILGRISTVAQHIWERKILRTIVNRQLLNTVYCKATSAVTRHCQKHKNLDHYRMITNSTCMNI